MAESGSCARWLPDAEICVPASLQPQAPKRRHGCNLGARLHPVNCWIPLDSLYMVAASSKSLSTTATETSACEKAKRWPQAMDLAPGHCEILYMPGSFPLVMLNCEDLVSSTYTFTLQVSVAFRSRLSVHSFGAHCQQFCCCRCCRSGMIWVPALAGSFLYQERVEGSRRIWVGSRLG